MRSQHRTAAETVLTKSKGAVVTTTNSGTTVLKSNSGAAVSKSDSGATNSTINSNTAISTTHSGAAVTTPMERWKIAGKSREEAIGVGYALKVLPDTEFALADGSNLKLERATTVTANVGVFEVAARETISESRFFVKRTKFAIAVLLVNGRPICVGGSALNNRGRSRTLMSFLILPIAHTASGSLKN